VLPLSKTLHVLALGLWFGSAVFFTLAGVVIFQTFTDKSRPPAADREDWFPLPALYSSHPRGRLSDRFPDPLRLEQGSRAAGAVVGPLFPWYFRLQAACAAAALLTALGWTARYPSRLNSLRLAVLFLALVSVGVGWWLELTVHDLRGPRNSLTDAVLRAPSPDPAEVHAAEEARATFGRWHFYSLLANFATLGLATVGMALAAHLPREGERP
jgi:hypothetical protein